MGTLSEQVSTTWEELAAASASLTELKTRIGQIYIAAGAPNTAAEFRAALDVMELTAQNAVELIQNAEVMAMDEIAASVAALAEEEKVKILDEKVIAQRAAMAAAPPSPLGDLESTIVKYWTEARFSPENKIPVVVSIFQRKLGGDPIYNGGTVFAESIRGKIPPGQDPFTWALGQGLKLAVVTYNQDPEAISQYLQGLWNEDMERLYPAELTSPTLSLNICIGWSLRPLLRKIIYLLYMTGSFAAVNSFLALLQENESNVSTSEAIAKWFEADLAEAKAGTFEAIAKWFQIALDEAITAYTADYEAKTLVEPVDGILGALQIVPQDEARDIIPFPIFTEANPFEGKFGLGRAPRTPLLLLSKGDRIVSAKKGRGKKVGFTE